MNLYQKKREKERLSEELENLIAEKNRCSKKLEYAQEILQANRHIRDSIEYFQVDKLQAVKRFQGLSPHQRSVQSMQYLLENRIGGQEIQSLHGAVEEKINVLAGMEASIVEEVEQRKWQMLQTEEKLKKIEREIRLQQME